jgi:transcriptional regulator GlxA family with amidase domain
MGPKRRVGILVFDGVTLLDVAGPSEVFTEASRFGADYEVMLYSADGQNVVSSTGMRFGVDAAARDSGPLDIALVAGTDDFPAHPVSPELAEAARTLATRAAHRLHLHRHVHPGRRGPARWPPGHHPLA